MKVKNSIKESGGFTIVELVISLFILVVAIIGVYNSFSTIVVLTTNTSSRLTAAYLVQEGVEIIRNMRDNNWINGEEEWTEGFLGVSGCSDGCEYEADYRTGTSSEFVLIPYPLGGNYLRADANNLYSYDSTAGETKFKRRITITQDPTTPDVFQVTVLVTWKEKGEEGCDFGYCIKAEEYLYNWYEF